MTNLPSDPKPHIQTNKSKKRVPTLGELATKEVVSEMVALIRENQKIEMEERAKEKE